MQGTFKKDNSLEKRIQLCEKIRKNYPHRVPIIVESAHGQTIEIKRKKFLAPDDINIGSFLTEIRKQSTLRPEEAMFIFCGENGGVLVPTSSSMEQVYKRYKSDDGFLYMTVALENTFGDLHSVEMAAFSVLDRVLYSSSSMMSMFT